MMFPFVLLGDGTDSMINASCGCEDGPAPRGLGRSRNGLSTSPRIDSSGLTSGFRWREWSLFARVLASKTLATTEQGLCFLM